MATIAANVRDVLRRGTDRTPRPADATRERSGLATQLSDAIVRGLLESPLADAVIERIVQALMRSGELDRLVTKVVTDLEASAAVDSLVDRQVDRVLEALRESSVLQGLIREQAGAYLLHLEKHPEPVQRLIREQSRGVVDEFVSALRQRGMSGDDTVESWVRRALGRA
jgi:hypothetical protein